MTRERPSSKDHLAEPEIVDWRDLAACKGHSNPDIFFPTSEVDEIEINKANAALAICAICVVKTECLDFAIKTNQPDGIWGGLLPREIKNRRKRMQAEMRRNKRRY